MDHHTRSAVLHHIAQGKNTDKKVSGIATIYLFPTIIGILGAFTPDIHEKLGIYAICSFWAVVIVSFLIISLRFNPSESAALALVVENEDLGKSIEGLEEDLGQLEDSISILSMQANYSKSIRATILQYKSKGSVSDLVGLNSMIDALASTLYIDGEFIFGL